jgi:hypothetical protein
MIKDEEARKEIERLDALVAILNAKGGGGVKLPQSIITWQPGAVSPVAPVYSDWNDIQTVVAALQGNAILIVDDTGTPGFMHIPSTANLDGFGRLEIVGGGPNGEAEIVIDDGGQIKNVRSWRTIAVRAEPTIRSPILYTMDGLIVETLDATFLFDNGGGGTLPIIDCQVPSYMGFFFIASSELRNSHNPGMPVLNIGPNALLFFTINALDFSSSFDTTISGPVTSSLQLQIDASVPPVIALPAFLGTLNPLFPPQIDAAPGVTYTPAVPGNWAAPPPTNVQQALDRIAAALFILIPGPIPP